MGVLRKIPDEELMRAAWRATRAPRPVPSDSPPGDSPAAPPKEEPGASPVPPAAVEGVPLPPLEPKELLSARELAFVKAFLGEARGNMEAAARIAGYKHASGVARRPRVERAIREALLAEAREKGVTKAFLVEQTLLVLQEGKPFERLKAIELLAKMLGHFAPTRSIRETVHHESKASAYDELARTLEEHGESLPAADREAMLQGLLQELAGLQRCIAILRGKASAH